MKFQTLFLIMLVLLFPLNSHGGKPCVGANNGNGVGGTRCSGNADCASAYECNYKIGGICIPRCGDGVGRNNGHGVDYANCISNQECAAPYECSAYKRCIPRQKAMSKPCVGNNLGTGVTGSRCSGNRDCSSQFECNYNLGGICVPRCGDTATSFPSFYK